MVFQKKAKQKSYILSSILTVLVICGLILIGPAQAVELNITPQSSNVQEDSWLSLTGSINIENTERVPIKTVKIEVLKENSVVDYCEYYINGTKKDCSSTNFENFSISSSYNENQGYGYGYGADKNGNYANTSYGYGYGYISSEVKDFELSVKWKTPNNLTANTEYKLRILAYAKGDNANEFTYSKLSTPFTVNNSIVPYQVKKNTTSIDFANLNETSEIEINTSIEENKTIKLNLSSTITNATTGTANITKELTITRKTTQADYKVTIPAGTQITGGTNWTGELNLPKVVDKANLVVSEGNIDSSIEIGFDDIELNFTKPVKLVFSGKAGQKVAWSRTASGTLSKIETVCDDLNNPTNINQNSPRECYIDSGSDLVVWTHHFTTFATYTPTTSSSSGGGSSSHIDKHEITSFKRGELYSNNLGEDDQIRFPINSQNHKLTLKEIDYKNKQIEITIESDPIKLTLNENEKVKVDIENDGKTDVQVWFEFENEKVAKVYIENIEPEEEKVEIINDNTENDDNTDEASKPDETSNNEKQDSNTQDETENKNTQIVKSQTLGNLEGNIIGNKPTIIAGIVGLLLIIGLVAFVMYKKKQNQQQQ